MNQSQPDGWKYRRRAIYSSLSFIAFCVLYLMVLGKDDDLRKSIADGLLTTGMWVIVTYTAGAVIDDHLKRGGKIGFPFKRQTDRDDSDGDGDSFNNRVDNPDDPQSKE